MNVEVTFYFKINKLPTFIRLSSKLYNNNDIYLTLSPIYLKLREFKSNI